MAVPSSKLSLPYRSGRQFVKNSAKLPGDMCVFPQIDRRLGDSLQKLQHPAAGKV
ncbi:MAG: hypothetical protein ACM3X0_02185 [Bacteroidota bacterium]